MDEEKAAVRIQARARGIQERRSGASVQKRKDKEQREQEKAAIKIQARARGMKLRGSDTLDRKRKQKAVKAEVQALAAAENELDEEEKQKRAQAAVKLQSRARGMKERSSNSKSASKRKQRDDESKAAVAIQSRYRGFQQRKANHTNNIPINPNAAKLNFQARSLEMQKSHDVDVKDLGKSKEEIEVEERLQCADSNVVGAAKKYEDAKAKEEEYQAALVIQKRYRSYSGQRSIENAQQATKAAEQAELAKHTQKIEEEQEQVRAAIKIQSRYRGLSARNGGIHSSTKMRQSKLREAERLKQDQEDALHAAEDRAKEVVLEYNALPEDVTEVQQKALDIVKGIVEGWALPWRCALQAVKSDNISFGSDSVRVLLTLSKTTASVPLPFEVSRVHFTVHGAEAGDTPSVTYHIESEKLERAVSTGEQPAWLQSWPSRVLRDKAVLSDVYSAIGC